MSCEDLETSTSEKPDISDISVCIIEIMQMMAKIKLLNENFDCALGTAVDYVVKYGDFDEPRTDRETRD